MSNINLSNFNDNDNEFWNQMVKNRMEQQKMKTNNHTIILDYLRETPIKYAIIGGKAALFHINKYTKYNESFNENYKYAISTDNYNVVVSKDNYTNFLNGLKKTLRMKSNSNLILKEGKIYNSLRLTQIGKRNTALINIHEHDNIKLKKRFPNTIQDDTGLKYATKSYIIDNLQHSIKHHASSMNRTKTDKRKARLKLLSYSNQL